MDSPAWLDAALQNLSRAGEVGWATADYLSARKTPIRFRKISPSAGAMWFLGGTITLNLRYFSPADVENPRLLSLLVHEARHLQQGPLVALSVFGELDAWQVDFNFQRALTGRFPSPLIEELCALPLVLERGVLEKARALMIQYAGKGYRVDLLPLFPLPQEIAWRLRR
ncbi:MAG: hypothetical protein CO094_11080 [Anaerolineae bacterium CG_4_9_14_3_um_filter_57_17]|nr:hypothetical protein [bacterium]NCT20435.1 hypothetical protein [bacterium]OIO83957.1 MAG: hypothetical protein AUK01_10770 [Anaerolineae bacterium CG2_30_57_67]PJB65095.1 MAG: hypothetical protein CO094_11080 [Anaerolineae bacterium CG_4_9_14_3_um_filter_57_17]